MFNRLAASINDGANIIVPNLELQGKVSWNNHTITRAAPWKFCNDIRANYSSIKKTGQHYTFNTILNRSVIGPKETAEYFSQLSLRFERGGEGCDQLALTHLLMDLEMTTNVSQIWKKNDRRFRSRFISTVGGVTRMENRT